MITLDLSKAKLAEDLGSYKEKVAEIHDMIRNKTGAGNDFLGWVELPENYDKEEVQLMKETATKLREKVDVLLVCGIGGSYLGARAAIEAINGLYSDDKVEIIYVGNTFSSNYIHQVAKYIEDKDFAINVISKIKKCVLTLFLNQEQLLKLLFLLEFSKKCVKRNMVKKVLVKES